MPVARPSSASAASVSAGRAVLFTAAELRAIREGRIDVAFRRWRRPSVKVGTRLRTAAGLLEILDVDRIAESDVGEPEAARSGAVSRADLLARLAARPGDLYRVTFRHAGDDPRLALRDSVPDDLTPLLARLERLDRAAAAGPWTGAVLALIGKHEGRRAADLATRLGRDTVAFKRDVRKLKDLGLTESLDVGYRLSARGRAVLAAVTPARSSRTSRAP